MLGTSKSESIESATPIASALKEQRSNPDYDCLPCRIMGSVAFTGLGFYTFISGNAELRKRERQIVKSGTRFGMFGRKVALYGMSTMLVGLGVFRLVN